MTPTTNTSPATRAPSPCGPVKPEDPLPSVVRTVTFGGRDWSLAYYAKNNAAQRAQQTAIIVAAIGLALTGIVCGLFGYVAYNNLRLSREIQVRIGFERRLTAVIDELNHRVKNILAVIQSIVTRTLRHGSDIDVSRELLIGRIHAMSNVVTLLSESQWQGVKLKGLFESRAIPHADRIVVNGPDIAVSARAAQSLSLLFFELASHSDEGLSLVGKHPHIVANWEVTGEDAGCDLSFPLGRVQHQRGDAAGRLAISASSCSIASRRKRWAAPRSAISPTSATSTNSPRRW